MAEDNPLDHAWAPGEKPLDQSAPLPAKAAVRRGPPARVSLGPGPRDTRRARQTRRCSASRRTKLPPRAGTPEAAARPHRAEGPFNGAARPAPPRPAPSPSLVAAAGGPSHTEEPGSGRPLPSLARWGLSSRGGGLRRQRLPTPARPAPAPGRYEAPRLV